MTAKSLGTCGPKSEEGHACGAEEQIEAEGVTILVKPGLDCNMNNICKTGAE